MANKISQAREAAAQAGRITPEQGCWIKYQLNLGNIRYKTVAYEAHVCPQMIAEFISGRKNSEKVRFALCKFLGYESFGLLLAAANSAKTITKGGVA